MGVRPEIDALYVHTEDWNLGVVGRTTAKAAEETHQIGLWLKPLHVPDPLSLVVLCGGPVEEVPMRPPGKAGLTHGAELKERIRGLSSAGLTDEQVGAGWERLNQQVRLPDPSEASRNPVPPSLWQLTARVCGAVGAGPLGLVTVAQVLTTTGSGGSVSSPPWWWDRSPGHFADSTGSD